MTLVNKISHRCFGDGSIPAKAMPLDIGVIFFVGIGGIGMSGIAEILHNLGYKVAGSDVSENSNVKRLRAMGIDIIIGQKAENIENVAVVVKSTAVPMTNPEIQAARARGIPVVRRSEMLAELTHLKATIAVAGTHGKTTTTSLVGRVMEMAGLDPTVINGGIINAHGTNAHLGCSDWLVAEADESDGTFIKIPATIGVITNIDPEHLDFWGDYTDLKRAFCTFIENLPFYGFAVMCYDHDEVRKLADMITDRRVVTYGIDSVDADIRAVNIRQDVNGSIIDVIISSYITGSDERRIEDIKLPIPGKHNISNALAAISVAIELKISDEIIISAFEDFSGVKRRFTKVGEVRGVTIIDDYGHHPVEIAATLSAARDVVKETGGKVIAVVQPHRYSRLENLFSEFCNCFTDADTIVVSEVYAAGEQPIEGVDRDALVGCLSDVGKQAIALESPDSLPDTINNLASKNDIVICLGAGTITNWANDLPDALKELR